MAYETVIYEKEDNIAIMTLNRPEVKNAFDRTMQTEMDLVLTEVARDMDARALIITGAGNAFCSGADIAYLMSVSSDHTLHMTTMEEMIRGDGNVLTTVLKIRNMPKPVIAAVNGVAAGGGFAIALACDIRLAADTARFNMVFTKRGVIPESGSTLTLPRLIGTARALELVFTAETVDAAEADRIGLVNRVHPADQLMTAAKELAAKMAQNSPIAMGFAKAAIYRGMVETDLAAQMDYEAYVENVLFGTEDMKEGIAAFLEGRPPKFPGR
ncbi:MAG: enoyl-CoA hydratase/isomerase family protein [Dehalococcoidia bacterium]|nr:MAG: enoyl-CoA hydratase/isomerase family protein [Dehalococcoidia bacterium]